MLDSVLGIGGEQTDEVSAEMELCAVGVEVGLKQEAFVISHFWRLKVWNEDVSMLGSF